jgi:hypothetical protein
MFRFQSTPRRLCLVLILLVLAALGLPTDPASAAPGPGSRPASSVFPVVQAVPVVGV